VKTRMSLVAWAMCLCGFASTVAGCTGGESTPPAATTGSQTPAGDGLTIDFQSNPSPPAGGDNTFDVTVAQPRIAVINNVDVTIESQPARIKDALVRQAASPVRWVETIRKMCEMGVTHIIECGPGKVLAGMNKRISSEAQSLTLADRASLELALQSIRGS